MYRNKWQTWKAQADAECLAKSRYESIAISLHIQLGKLLQELDEDLHGRPSQESITVARIIHKHCNPHYPYGKPEDGN